MFYNYQSGESHKGLFKSCIVPRPIAWISTKSKENITNLAPFSYFQAVCDEPPMIMFVASPKS
jgi:flavin reductase (DIM6/NTAB) family NADH-FMN oxidoreductase RutF